MVRFFGLAQAAVAIALCASPCTAQQSFPAPDTRSSAATQPQSAQPLDPAMDDYHAPDSDRYLNTPLPDNDFLFQALTAGGGVAKAHCFLEPDTRLHNCKVVEETPPGRGVGKALLTYVGRLRIRPLQRNAQAVQHEKIEIALTVKYKP
jgi:hypothetical protein